MSNEIYADSAQAREMDARREPPRQEFTGLRALTEEELRQQEIQRAESKQRAAQRVSRAISQMQEFFYGRKG